MKSTLSPGITAARVRNTALSQDRIRGGTFLRRRLTDHSWYSPNRITPARAGPRSISGDPRLAPSMADQYCIVWAILPALNGTQDTSTTMKVKATRSGLAYLRVTNCRRRCTRPRPRSASSQQPCKPPHMMYCVPAPCHKPLRRNTISMLRARRSSVPVLPPIGTYR